MTTATTKTIRTILVDDEPLALRGLEIRLNDLKSVDIVSQCANGREAVKKIKELRPDLVFLDIQMPGLDGFDVVRSLIDGPMPIIVFVTAFDKFAIEAFEANALDYLVKPVDETRLREAVSRACTEMARRCAERNQEKLMTLLSSLSDKDRDKIESMLDDTPAPNEEVFSQRINFRDGKRVINLNTELIDWIESAGDYVCIHAAGKTYIVRETMKSLEKRLDPSKFQRVHRSAIVNLDKVQELHPHSNGEYFLILEDGGRLKMSRSYKKLLARFS